MPASGGRGLLRARGDADQARVDFAELFFDLVFVFAITQLSHRLIELPTREGALQTLILFVAIWWSWINTAWITNWLDPRRLRVRLLLFALMAAGLFVSMSIPLAFAERGAVFAAFYVAMEVGRSLFTMLALKGHEPANFRNFRRILVWQLLAGACWLAGAAVAGEARFYWWAAALAIWSVSPTFGFYVPGLGRSVTADWRVNPHHMAERCGLFIILALGESILVTGATFGRLDWSPPALAGFAAALAGTVAMWWLYFNVGARRAARAFEASPDTGRVGRLAYTYIHLPIVAGIVIAAAADEWVLAHPTGQGEPHAALGAIGGPALYLAGNGLFKRVMGAQYFPLSHLIGLMALALLAWRWPFFEPFALHLAVAALLIAVAIWETVSLRAVHGRDEGEGKGERK